MSQDPRRLDQALVERGLVPSRTRAREWIESGRVSINGKTVAKPATPVLLSDSIEVDPPESRWVSRGADKLLAALDRFGVDPSGKIALDIGASTGGFTEVLLTRGAAKVFSIDVGHGQLDQRLKSDPRVINVEKYHARYFNPADFAPASLLVMDVSFISIRLVVPAVLPGLVSGADLVVLFKPQFEVGREHIGSGGIVREPELRERALLAAIDWSKSLPLLHCGAMESPVVGGDGNHEYLIHWKVV
jgi:23S rRNA (cytidine1920-2'-O)/16S rRNA (cytidine1409-2'-O)-methyltransferase